MPHLAPQRSRIPEAAGPAGRGLAPRAGLPAYDVVIPAWRAGATVARAVASALRQTHPPAAVILVDDCHETDYRGILGGAGLGCGNLVVERSARPASGPAEARNLGLGLATADVVMVLDADDCMAPTRAEALVPLAWRLGVATDRTMVVRELADGAAIRLGPGFRSAEDRRVVMAGVEDILAGPASLYPVFRRDLVPPGGYPLVDRCEDQLFLLSMAFGMNGGCCAVYPGELYHYVQRQAGAGSTTLSADATGRFRQSYLDILAGLREGRYGLPDDVAARAVRCFRAKLEANEHFGALRGAGLGLDYVHFHAGAPAAWPQPCA